MPNSSLVFVVGSDVRPEVILFVASAARSFTGRIDVRFLDEEGDELLSRDPSLAGLRLTGTDDLPSHAKVIVCGDVDTVQTRGMQDQWRISLVREPAPSIRLETEGRRFSFPLVMSSTILRRLGRSLSEVPRVLVAVDGEDNRRERMIARVCEELGRRRFPHVLVAVAAAEKAARSLAPAEAYVNPEAFELASLVASGTLVLDPSEGDDAPSSISCLAASVGVPVVTHASSVLVRRKLGEIRPVADWSPDAFADAVIEVTPNVPPDLLWGAEFDAVAEDLGRVIRSG